MRRTLPACGRQAGLKNSVTKTHFFCFGFVFVGLTVNNPEVEQRRRTTKMRSILAKTYQPRDCEMLHLCSIQHLNNPSSCNTEQLFYAAGYHSVEGFLSKWSHNQAKRAQCHALCVKCSASYAETTHQIAVLKATMCETRPDCLHLSVFVFSLKYTVFILSIKPTICVHWTPPTKIFGHQCLHPGLSSSWESSRFCIHEYESLFFVFRHLPM